MDMVCGVMQLLQAIYNSLPFNPSNINDANFLTSKLTRPDIVSRINRLIEFSEIRTQLLEKTTSTSENVEQDFISSVDSSKPSTNIYEDEKVKNTQSADATLTSNVSQLIVEVSCEDSPEKPDIQTLHSENRSTEHHSELKSGDFEECHQMSSPDCETAVKEKPPEGSSYIRDSTKVTPRTKHLDVASVHHMNDVTADPIRCIGALITTLKGVKVNYIHSMKCLKRRHRNCEYGMCYDHHHDILGSPHYASSNSTQYYTNDADYEHSPSHSRHLSRRQSVKSSLDMSSAPGTCVVAELATILLDYISEAKFKASRIHLMSTLRSVGVCCCLQPEAVISAIVPQLPVFSHAVRSYALDTLTSILLDHFQGAQEAREVIKLTPNSNSTKNSEKFKSADSSVASYDSSRCVHCYLEGSSPLLAGLPTAMDSGFSSCDIEEMRRQKLLERWKSLRLLQKIIMSKDEGLALTCAKHLMTLAIRGNSQIKEELFFGVYLHVLFMKVRMPRRFSEQSRCSLFTGNLLDKPNTGDLLDKTNAGDLLDKTNAQDLLDKTNKVSKDMTASDAGLLGDNQSSVPSVSCSISRLNSQESLNDSFIIGGSLASTDLSTTDDSLFVGSVSSSVMLLCVSALPYVLQVDKVMSIFLAKKGLAKLTDLLEYEQLRSPVMSVFEALIMIDERRLRDSHSDHRSVYEGGGVIQTFIDTLAKRTCMVTATLQQISLQNSKDKTSRSPKTLLMDDELMKAYKSSVSDESSSASAEKKSTSKEFCVDEITSSNMIETLPVLLDMWKTCAKLCMNSRMFRAYYRESPCLYVVQETLVLALSLLGELSETRRWSIDIDCLPQFTAANTASTDTTDISRENITRSFSVENTKFVRSFSIEPAAASEAVGEDEDRSNNILFSHEAKLEFIEAVMMVCFSCHTISPSQTVSWKLNLSCHMKSHLQLNSNQSEVACMLDKTFITQARKCPPKQHFLQGHEDELWLRLNSALKSCIHLEASKLSAVFHMLLNVALPRCPSVLEYSYSQIVSMLNLREREDIADEDEVKKLLQQGIEEDGDAIFTEHGYEGDTECSVCFDWKKGESCFWLEYSLENQAVPNSGSSSCTCFPAVFRLFVELMIACHRIASRGVILHTVALRLLQTLRSSRRAVRAFCSEHLLEVLMEGFQEVLIHCPSNGKQSTLQEIILSLIQVAGQSEISASELRRFLVMFQNNTQTTNSLLSTLLAVIEKTIVLPNYSAAFPVKTVMGPETSSSSSEASDNRKSTRTDQAVWQHTAVELDVPGISWPPNPSGFTVAIWLCLDEYQICVKKDVGKKTAKDRGGKPYSGSEEFDRMFTIGHRLSVSECLLVFAIGNKEKMFEVWVHPRTGSVYCRLTTGLFDVGVLKDCTFEHLLKPNTWHLLTINYSESLDGSTFMGKLNVLLDGWQRQSAILDHSASVRRKDQKIVQRPALCIGDARHGVTKLHTGSWKLGTLRLFRDVGLSDDWWLHLYCLGPNCEGLSKCDCGELRACYIPAMQKHKAGVMNLTWDVLVGMSQLSDLDVARAAQVLVYRINQPEQYTIFTSSQSHVDSTHSDLGLVPLSGSVSDLLTQKPVAMPARMRGRVKVRELNTLEKAIQQAGGIEAFLFLVAKIFEDSMKAVSAGGSLEMAEYLQSKATHILFQLVHKFPTLTQAFMTTNGYAMLAKVLTSSKSIVGYQLLKVLMDACTTESVFKTSQNSSRPVLLNHPEAVIRDIEILSQLLLHWRIWHKAGDDVTATLFQALEALVSSRHPHRNFNLKQMQAGGVMNKIFSIYLERIQDGQPSLSVKVSQSAAKVITGLLGSPPELHLLMSLMDFLLLVHPAASGFISFTPSSFYFKLWWESARSRATSSNQHKARVVNKHANSESSATRQTESTDQVDSRTPSVQESVKSSSAQLLPKSQTVTSISCSADSQEEEGIYKYPPLKATKAEDQHILDTDTDHEVKASGHKMQQETSTAKNGEGVTRSASSLGQHGTTEIARSFRDSDDSQQKPQEESVIEKKEATEGQDKEDRKDSVANEDTEDEARKHILMYLSSVSDKQSDLDDASVNLTDSGDLKTAIQQEEQKDSGSVTFDKNNSKSEKTAEAPPRPLDEEESDQGLILLCVSLIEYLTQIVHEFAEASLDNVFSKVVNPKSLLVLAKNPSSDMRLAVIKLLGAYLSKAPSNLIDAFIKMDGFYLLANQLRSFSVCWQHVETAVSILLGHRFTFDDNFIVDDLGELSTVQQAAPVLLLSLLDGTASDTELCRNSLTLLSQLLEANSTMSTLLLDIGLAETMCNLATNIQRRNSSKPSLEEKELTNALLIDVQLVLCSASVREFGWTGPSHFQNVDDMFTLLKALEDYEFNRDTEASKKRAETARAFQISLVVKILEYVEKRSGELMMAANMGWLTASTAISSSNNKPRHLVARNTVSSNSFSAPLSSNPRVKADDVSLPLRPPQVANLIMMRRTTFSSPDIMGFLAETTDDRSNISSQIDSDSSGSIRPMLSPRPDAGNKPSRLGSLFSRKRKLIYASVSQSDLLDRFKKILVMAVDLAVMFPREEQVRPQEQRTLSFLKKETRPASLEDRYLKHLFLSVYRFYEQSLNKELSAKKYKNPTMHGAKDVLRVQFTRLLLCMMSLKVHFDLRTYALAFIMTEPYGKDAVKAIIADKQVGTELCFYLYNLLATWKDWLNPTEREYGFALMSILRNADFSINKPDEPLTQAQVNALVEEKKQIDLRYRKELAVWLQKREVGTVRITNKFEPVRRRIAEQAMTVTQDVTRLQVEERKKFVALIKRSMTTQIQLKKQWQELVQNLTHERAVWYQKLSYPQSWQLDPTEGPGRVRKRLQRCHLEIERRFLLPSHQQKLDAVKVDPPLIFLFEDDHQMADSAALTYRLYTNEKIQHTCKCTVVSPASESKGELLVGEACIFFVADGAITVANYTQMLLGNLDQLSITWPHTDIRELHKRWYQLQDVGLEIFLISGRTCLLAFQTTQDRDYLYNMLRSSLELPNLIAGESLQAVQQAWLEGEVTNYDYLMYLNKLAGRSYADLMQYPVFPFVLKNYHSSMLDLTHPQEYRNLRKPIAVQDKSREKRYRDNYEFLCQEANRPHSDDEMVRVAPFHYGSHYSNSGTVLHYLVRLPPFTKMFLTYQDRNFDIPDRTFHSLSTSWRLSSFESSTDVKELIPEFFFLPEMFINNEGFDFGLRQNGERVNHVTMPPWCGGDARLFVLINRQALESTIVTRHLHLWIDLVFGYKQQGEEAVKAINVFHPSTYFGVDASGIKDNVKRQALLTMIRTYGQTPKQLFRNPHTANQVRWSVGDSEKHKLYTCKPVPTVSGLKWGNYVGSPDLAPPVSQEIGRASSIKRLVAVRTGQVFGVERNSNILLLHAKQRDLAVRSVDVMWAGVITWGYHDNIIRIRSYQDKPLINFLPPQPSCGRISCVESVPDCRLLFIAGSAGIINVYSMTHNSSK
ncbi:unnamed protein product, partial [Candidula unifasciata]